MNTPSARAQEIRKQATKWSLQGDSQLLDYMKEISQKLENLARDTDLRLNRMCLSGQEVNVELGNVTNRLLALQHTQFVENRVHEEEEVPAKEEKKEAPETRQMSPMSTLKTILGDSVVCLNNCYERVEVELDEDSGDEDEPTRSVVFRPRDPYGHRPLPYVIGSREFKEKWHVGLVDSESESENEEDAQFSESGSESGHSVSLPSAGGSEADSVWGLQATSNALAHKSASQMSSEDEQSSKILDQRETHNPVPAQRAYFQPPKLTPRTTVPQDPAPNLFSDSPPRVPGLSKATGLFDDLEEDDFDAPPPSNSDTKPPTFFRDQPDSRRTVNLFDDEPPEFEPPTPVPKTSTQSGLFVDSDNDEDFQVPVSQHKEQIPSTSKQMHPDLFNEEPPMDSFGAKSTPKKPPTNLFDDDDDLDSLVTSLSSAKKKDASEETKSTINTTKPKLANLFDDDDEPDDFLETLLKGARAKTKSQPLQTKKRTDDKPVVKNKLPAEKKKEEKILEKPPKKKATLFGDSDDEDIFGGGSKTEARSKKEEVQEKKSPEEVKEKILPIEIPEEIFTPKEESEIKKDRPEVVPRKSLEVEPREIFAEKVPEQKKEIFEESHEDAQPISHQEQKPPTPPNVPPTDDLFDIPPDDDEPPPPAKKDSKLLGLFDDFDDEEDFFLPKPAAERLEKPTNVPLFDDLPPDDDLFVDRKVISEVFYDDFAESFPPEVVSVNPTGNSYLFNDEPPADDWQVESRGKEFPEAEKNEVDGKEDQIFSRSSSKDEPDEIFSSVRNLIKSHEKVEIPTEEPLNKPKIVPNKLNKTMAINVAALLPGAKRPSFKTAPEDAPVSPPAESLVTENPPEFPEENPEEKVEEALRKINEKSIKGDADSLLTSLNKNRARIPQKRKPSTRRGRQETYRKSLIVEDEEISGNTQNSLFDGEPPKIPEDVGEKFASLPQVEKRKSEPKNAKETHSGDFLTKDTEKPHREHAKEAKKKSVKKLEKSSKSVAKSLFESDDEDDSDIFATKKLATISKSTSEPTKMKGKATSLFGDSESDDDDLFGSTSKSNATKISAPIAKVDKKIAKKSATGDDPLADLF